MLTDIACKSTTCPADKPRARFADTGGLANSTRFATFQNPHVSQRGGFFVVSHRANPMEIPFH